LNQILTIKDLPPPPNGKMGFPWTEGTPPQYIAENLPKISIITPSFNQGQFIEETIRSVLLQNYPNLEYIIIDGGSTDNTVEIIKKYSDFIHYWVSEKDTGQSNAINKGLKHATGDVFNWLNSDDYYLPNALLTIGNYFSKHPHLDVLCGREIHLSPDGQLSKPTQGTVILPTLEATIALGNCNQPPTFFRLSVVQQLGELSENLYFCMDSDLWIRYLAHFGISNVLKIDAVINVFRLHAQSKSISARHIYYSDRFNILMSLITSASINDFPKLFFKENDLFKLYFHQNYPLSILDKKKLSEAISENLLHYYAQYMSWQGFFELYFYTLKQTFWGRKVRLYFAPFIKLKRLLILRK
jgi:glycosyltransferase involved in cell wall biosynthesis